MSDFIARQNSERLRQRVSAGLMVREPPAFSKLARSVVEMALVTGVVVRLYRALVLTHAGNGLYIGTMFLLGSAFVLLMATAHLSRFPLRQWTWRAPAFGALESAFESIASLGLIVANREPLGTSAATLGDWPGIAATIFMRHVVVISAFALLLALMVKLVRYQLLKREHAAWSAGTVRAGLPGEAILDRRRNSGAQDKYVTPPKERRRQS
ncbi:MAG TPA: hypothetical protein VES88_10740 [Gemmatimonadaceae bacterium]|nr:hypothetical protein [Gemmatimonadaceae bacterium]